MACEYCNMEYSFYFNMQFHKKDCPALKGKGALIVMGNLRGKEEA